MPYRYLTIIPLVACMDLAHPPRVPDAQRDAAVTVRTACGYGSGVIVGRDRVLTAAHVVRCPALAVESADHHVYPAAVSALDEQSDVALLSTDGAIGLRMDAIGPLVPPPIDPRDGMRVCIVPGGGKEQGVDQGRLCGRVLYVSPPPGRFGTSVPVYPGYSGAGVYDDRGHIVGILTLRVPGGSVVSRFPIQMLD